MLYDDRECFSCTAISLHLLVAVCTVSWTATTVIFCSQYYLQVPPNSPNRFRFVSYHFIAAPRIRKHTANEAVWLVYGRMIISCTASIIRVDKPSIWTHAPCIPAQLSFNSTRLKVVVRDAFRRFPTGEALFYNCIDRIS